MGRAKAPRTVKLNATGDCLACGHEESAHASGIDPATGDLGDWLRTPCLECGCDALHDVPTEEAQASNGGGN